MKREIEFFVNQLLTYHFLILISSWWIGCCHCTWTTFSIPWWLLMFRCRWDWDCINWTSITITTIFISQFYFVMRKWFHLLAIILSSSTITWCPNVNNTFTITTFGYSFDKSSWSKCAWTFNLEQISHSSYFNNLFVFFLTVRPSSLGPHEAE
jgi:hypothetical protein